MLQGGAVEKRWDVEANNRINIESFYWRSSAICEVINLSKLSKQTNDIGRVGSLWYCRVMMFRNVVSLHRIRRRDGGVCRCLLSFCGNRQGD